MNNWFVIVVILIYVLWLLYFISKLKKIDIKDEHLKDEVDILVDAKYTEALAFKKSKNYLMALQKNIGNQIYNIVDLAKNKDGILWTCLDCLKDTVDLSDMTFYVGNDMVNMLLREKVRRCYYKNITLDVVADITDVNIDSKHMVLIFSNIIDMAIKHIENNRANKANKCKIIVRASKSLCKTSNFFVLQIAYNMFNNSLEDLNFHKYINKHYQNMMYLIEFYDGTIISKQKGNKIVKTVTIPLCGLNCEQNTNV